MPDVFDTLTDEAGGTGGDVFDEVALTGEEDKRGESYGPAGYLPQWLVNAGEAAADVAGGLVKGAFPAAVRTAVFDRKMPSAYEIAQLTNPVVAAGAQSVDQIRGAVDTAKEIAAADKTPALSKERFHAGFSTAAQLAMLAGLREGVEAGFRPSRALAEAEQTRPVKPVKLEEASAAPPPDVFDEVTIPPEQVRVGTARTTEPAPQTVAAEAPIQQPAGSTPVPAASTEPPPMTNPQGEWRGGGQVDPEAIAAANEASAAQVFEDARAARPAERPISAEEQARLDYEAELAAAADEAQAAQGKELLEAIADAGGLPARGSKFRGIYKGEIEHVETFVRNPQRTERISPNKMFRNDAPAPDELTSRLRDQGFQFDTPDELFEAVKDRLRTGRRVYGLPELTEALSESGNYFKPGEGPKLRAAEKGTADLFQAEDQPFNLAGETGIDYAARQAAAEKAAADTAAATAASEAAQGQLFKPGVQPQTLPRQIAAQQLPANQGVPVSEASIREYLAKSLDIPIRAGMNIAGGMRRALGVFRVKPETIRTKLRNDLPTIAHETGHYIHHLLFTDPTGKPTTFAGAFDHELLPLGQRTSLPSYTAAQVRMEGVAEFMSDWLQDRSKAMANAPGFAAHFESELKTKFPQTWDILENARDQVARFIAQPGWEKAKSKIVFDSKQPRATFREWLYRKYTDWFNELAPIDRTMKRLQEFGLAPDVAAQVSDRAVNYKGGWRGKADFDLEFEQTDINGNRLGPGLKTILKGLDPKELGDFSTYLALKRAKEKALQGIRTGFESELSDPATTSKLSQLAARYEPRRQQLIQYSENHLRLLKEAGYFDDAQIARIRAANKDYVPFYRIYEGVSGRTATPRGAPAGGFVNTSSGVLRMKGSDRQIIDPLESIVKNTYAFRDLAERNRVGREFVAAVEATQGGGRVGESVIKPIKPTHVSHEEMVAKLKSLGMDDADINALGADLGLTIWRAADGVNAKQGVFRVWEGGKERLFQVDDGDLLRALSLSDSIDASVVRLLPLFKPFAAITKFLRVGATLTPEFIARNPFRDQVTAAVFSRYGFVPFFDGFRGLLSVLRKDQYYRDWIKQGGRYSGLYDVESASMRHALERAIADPNVLQQAMSWVRHPLQTLAQISSAMEEATRVAEYRRASNAGADAVVAANAAKDVTLNFSRSGLKGKVVNQLMAFFNAGLQDLDKMVRAHKQAPVRTVAKAFMYITVPSILTWLLGKDDQEIQNLPEWRKSFFWNLHIGDHVYSLPKPFLLGALYGTSVEKGLDYAYGRDPNAVKKALDAIWSVGSPARGDMITATNAFKPLVENITNYSFFKGQPLVNEGQAKLSPALQFNPTTSETGKFVGRLLGVSPIKIDNLIRGYFGGLGKYGTDGIDWAMLKMQSRDTPVPPARDVSQLPLIRGFMKQPYEPSEYVGRFYRAIDEAERRQNDFRTYGDRLDAAGMKEFFMKNRDPLAWYNAQSGDDRTVMTELRGIRENLSDINKAMVVIQQSRTISAQDKAARLGQLSRLRDQISKAAFDTMVHPIDRQKVF